MKDALLYLRKRDKKTQKQIADLLCVSQAAYSKYENGIAEPDSKAISKLADFYDVTSDFILGRNDIEKKPAAEAVSFDEFSNALLSMGIDTPPKQKELLDKINNLSEEQIKLLLQMIDNFKNDK